MQSKPHARLNWLAISPILLAILLFPSAWNSLGIEWLSGEQDNSHALPSFIAALFIAFTSSYAPVRQTSLRLIIFLILTITLGTAYFIFQIANITQLTYLMAIVGSIVLFIWLFGFRPFHTLMLIATLLILSLPVWDALLEPLVIIASEVVTWFLAWFDITVLIEGNSILTPYGRILIAEGCSGIRYLLVAIVLGALVSHVNHYRFRGSAAALAIFTFVGLLSNWVRIILLIFTGYFTNMESSLMHDHEVFGWIIYSVFFLPIIYFAPRSNAAIKTERHTAPLNLAPMLIALITLIIVINVSLFIAQSQFRTETKHPVSPVADSFIQESLPAELKTLPMTTLNDLTWYASKFTSTRVGIFNNSKNSMEEKLIPYIPQSLVNERWFNEKKYSLHLNGLNVETHQLKSLYSNQRLLRAQVYATGTLWSSEYSIAKLQQVPALLSGNNLFTYYLFVTPCVTFNCENAISELSRDIQDILAK